MKITEKTIDFLRLSAGEKQQFFQELLAFDQKIFPNASRKSLHDFIYDHHAVSVQVVRYYDQEQLIGQNIIPVLKLRLAQRPILVLRSRAGFVPRYRRLSLSLHSAIRIAILQRIKHPVSSLWFVPSIMQPKVYMLLASRTKHFFPRDQALIPHEYLSVLSLIKEHQAHVDERDVGVFVHPCDLPKVSAEYLVRLRNISETHVNYFIKQVPDYFDGYGLMCVCKLDLKTLCQALFNLTVERKIS